MKRLLKISLDTLMQSLSNIIIWIILSIAVDKNLINIFILTYPLNYLSSSIKSIFGTGANISSEKGNMDDNFSGIISGIIFSFVIFIAILINSQGYLSFINLSVSKIYVNYYIIFLFIQTVFDLIMINLYYQHKTSLANKYNFIFYTINIISILITSILFANAYLIIIPPLVLLLLYVIYVLVKNCKFVKYKLNIIKWINYDLVDLSDNIFLGLSYLFGINISINFGEQYALALTFVGLITDIQWDISAAITTVAKIDISKNKFNFKDHLKNACILVFMLICSSSLMFQFLYKFYELNLFITFDCHELSFL